MNLMFEPLRKYAQFDGRARRSEFWLFWLFIMIVQIVFNVLVATVGGGAMTAGAPPAGPVMGLYMLLGAFGLAVLVPGIAVAFRRLHDTNRSAWWLLIALIPFIGALVLIVFYLLPGTPGENRFGPDPKAPAEAAGIVAA
jgi:uncharacterized membrane protein YhaH (DUF805 family)